MKQTFTLFLVLVLLLAAACAFAEPTLILSETSLTLAKGKTAKLSYEAKDLPEGEKIKVTWSTQDKKTATVTNGIITGAGTGDTTVTAATTLADGTELSAACAVHVYLPVASLSLGGQTMTLNAGQSETLTLTAKPEGAEYSGATFESSDSSVLTVDETGTVNALTPGTATVTATSMEPVTNTAKPKTAKIKVTVNRGSEAVAFSSPFVTVGKGKNITLKPAVLPEDATNKKVTFSSSDTGIASVTSSGQVTGKSSGQCVVTATAADGSGASASCIINVVTAITALSPESKTITVNTGIPSEPLGLKFTPSDATCQRVTWESSDPETADVDDNGVVLGKKPGKVTITATSLEDTSKPKSASFTITVNRPAAGFVLSVGKTVPKGGMITPEAIFQPADTTVTKLSWTSSNPKIADVTPKGQIRGVGVGKCTLTATTTDGTNLSQTCEIEVIQGVTALKPNTTGRVYVYKGQDRKVSVTASPSDATNKKVSWESSDSSIAYVDNDGVITGRREGTCTITATTEDGTKKTAKFNISVEPACPVTIENITVYSYYYGDYNALFVKPYNHSKYRTVKTFVFDFEVYSSSGRITYDGRAEWSGNGYKSFGPQKYGNCGNWHWYGITGLTSASKINFTAISVTFTDGETYTIPYDDRVTTTFR